MTNKKKQGSALLITTILLFVIVSMVVSLSSFTIMEQKMSQKTKSSTRAFYNSESGIEWALNKIATTTASDINTAFSVANPGNGINCPAIIGGASNCRIYLLDSEGKVITNGSLEPSQIKAVRSVGTQNQETQRAIEAAVAATSCTESTFNVSGFTMGASGVHDDDVSMAGAREKDFIFVSPPYNWGNCSSYLAYVTSNDHVNFRVVNAAGGANCTVNAGTWRMFICENL